MDAPAPTATAPGRLRCLQRPTGEWFTFAAGNAPGKDTPDAAELFTEAEARQQLADRGVAANGIDDVITQARAQAEVSGDIADWNAPPSGPAAER